MPNRTSLTTSLIALAIISASCGGSDAVPTSETAGPNIVPVVAENGFALDDVTTRLTEPNQTERYTFEVADSQTVIFEELGQCTVTDEDQLVVTLTGAITATVSPNVANLSQNTDCDNATRLTAGEAGTVNIAVTLEDGTGTGTFSFQIVADDE
jgi:hypothetical protein|tara:strand:- start:959 stop:1420 length:462 start_codon:yes stop_codon:yes gene_type:complete